MEVVKNLDGTWEKVPPQTTDEVCETCGAPMTIKRGRFGSFLACTRYPDCKTTKPISLGVKCPRPGCGGFIAEKRVASRQAVLRLLELGEEAVRLRRVGQADPAAVPDLPGEVRRSRRRPSAASRSAAWSATGAAKARTSPKRTRPDEATILAFAVACGAGMVLPLRRRPDVRAGAARRAGRSCCAGRGTTRSSGAPLSSSRRMARAW